MVLFAAVWAVLHYGFYADNGIVDTPVYQRYGDAIVDGQVPYDDFSVEYPPAALPVFALPSVIVSRGASLDDYDRAFGFLMAICGAAAIALVAYALVRDRAGPARVAVACAFVALSPLALGSVVLTRFDLWPAALVAGALALLLAGRDRLSLGVLGLNGITAYFGLLDLGLPRAGDTVVVSTAAGAVADERVRDGGDPRGAADRHQEAEGAVVVVERGAARDDHRREREDGQRGGRVLDREVVVRDLPVDHRVPVALVHRRVDDAVVRVEAVVEHGPGNREQDHAGERDGRRPRALSPS